MNKPFYRQGMVTLEQYKKALGKKAENFSDKELLRLMSLQDKIAGTLFDIWKNSVVQSRKTENILNSGGIIKL
jgi:hypothetical protein